MAHSLAVHQREILRRADPRHIRLTLEVAKAFERPAFPLATVASLLDGKIGMGTSTRTASCPRQIESVPSAPEAQAQWSRSDAA